MKSLITLSMLCCSALYSQTGLTISPAGAAGTASGVSFTQAGTGAASLNVRDRLRQTISVEDFGAVSDNSTNNDTAIANAIAAMHAGQTLLFPCTASAHQYKVTTKVDFSTIQNMTLAGSGDGCYLHFIPASSGGTVGFEFKGSYQYTVKDLSLYCDGGSNVAKGCASFARPVSGGFGGRLKWVNGSIEGYASQALVYSIASEENSWVNPTFILNGGGAKYVFYTSTADDLSVASYDGGSNLDVWMTGSHINNFSSSRDQTHALIMDVSTNSDGGDHTYENNYWSYGASGGGGTCIAFRIPSAGTGNSFMRTTVRNNRCENGARWAWFDGGSGGAISNLYFSNNTHANDPGVGLVMYQTSTGVEIDNSEFFNDTLYNGETSTFAALRNVHIREPFPVTVSGAIVNSRIEKVAGFSWSDDEYNAAEKYIRGALKAASFKVGTSGIFDVDSGGSFGPGDILGTGNKQNYVKYSEFDPGFTNFNVGSSVWYAYGEFSGTPCNFSGSSPTGNNTSDTTDPLGGNTALKIVASSTCHGIQQYSLGLTSGLTYTVSAWVKGAAGSESCALSTDDAHGADRTFTTSWARYSFTGIITDTGRGFQFYCGNSGQTVYIWGAQVVLGSSAGKYVKTGATAASTAVYGSTVENLGVTKAAAVQDMAIAGKLTSPIVTVTGTSAPAFDLSKGSVFSHTLGANATATVSNVVVGGNYKFLICQGGTAYTFTWPSTVKGGMTVGSTINTCSQQKFTSYDGVNLRADSPGVTNQ